MTLSEQITCDFICNGQSVRARIGMNPTFSRSWTQFFLWVADLGRREGLFLREVR